MRRRGGGDEAEKVEKVEERGEAEQVEEGEETEVFSPTSSNLESRSVIRQESGQLSTN